MVEAMCQGVTDRCFCFYYIVLDHVRAVFFARVGFSLQIVSSLSFEVAHKTNKLIKVKQMFNIG